MPREPDRPHDSRTAILEAAAAEFADRGFDGVRMEHVAARAGYNKALVYRQFGDKQGLFRETLRHRFQRREAMIDGLPPTLPELLVWWSRQQRAEPDFMRLILREALQDHGEEPVEAASRRAYYARQVAMVEALQARGDLDDQLDAKMLFFALLTLTVGPVQLPQIARLVGPADTDEYTDQWEGFLRVLADKLRPSLEPGPGSREQTARRPVKATGGGEP